MLKNLFITFIFIISAGKGSASSQQCLPELISEEVQALSGLAINCFENRSPSTGYLSQQAQLDLIKSDFEVCMCLIRNPNPAVSEAIANTNYTQDEMARFIGGQVSVMFDEAVAERDALMFHASTMAPDSVTAANISQAYEDDVEEKLERSKNDWIRNVRNFTPSNLPRESHENFRNAAIGLINENSSKRVESINSRLLNDDPRQWPQDQQCVGIREFLSFRAQPTGDTFYHSLKELDSFNENDWDIESLVNKAAGSADFVQRARIAQLRMSFLQKNPLISQLFQARGHTAEKRRLFNIIKIMAPNQSCSRNECRKLFMETKYQDYRNQLMDFFADPKIVQIITDEVSNNLSEKTIHPNLDTMTFPRSRTALERQVQLLTSLDSNKCVGTSVNVQECITAFRAYCPMVNTAMLRNSSEQLSIENALDLKASMNTDINSNIELKDFNENICSSPRRNTGSLPGMPSEASFFQFRDAYCRDNATAAGCSEDPYTKGDPALIQLYLENYGTLKTSNADLDNDSMAFKAFLTKGSPPTIANEEIDEMRNSGPPSRRRRDEIAKSLGADFRRARQEISERRLNADAQKIAASTSESAGNQEIKSFQQTPKDNKSSLAPAELNNIPLVSPTTTLAGPTPSAVENQVRNNRQPASTSEEEKQRHLSNLDESSRAEIERIRQEAMAERQRAYELSNSVQMDRIKAIEDQIRALEQERRDLTQRSQHPDRENSAESNSERAQSGGTSTDRTEVSQTGLSAPRAVPSQFSQLPGARTDSPESNFSEDTANSPGRAGTVSSGNLASNVLGRTTQPSGNENSDAASLVVTLNNVQNAAPAARELSQEVIKYLQENSLNIAILTQIKEKGITYRFRLAGEQGEREVLLQYNTLSPEARRILEEQILRQSELVRVDRELQIARRTHSYEALKFIIGQEALNGTREPAVR